MPSRAQKLSRQKAASLSVVDSWCAASARFELRAPDRCAGRLTRFLVRAPLLFHSMQLIEPKAPLALRLAAVLMRGVVQLYSRQLFFLSGAPLLLRSCSALALRLCSAAAGG